jgi:hypothetical protein
MEIKVVAYYQDGGDGSGNFTVYNDLNELQKDLKLSDERLQEILNEDDPYDNGEIQQNVTIKLEEVDGKLRLAESFYLHWGQ